MKEGRAGGGRAGGRSRQRTGGCQWRTGSYPSVGDEHGRLGAGVPVLSRVSDVQRGRWGTACWVDDRCVPLGSRPLLQQAAQALVIGTTSNCVCPLHVTYGVITTAQLRKP